MTFVDKLDMLCAEKGISPSRMCLNLGLSRSLASKWKNTNGKPNSKITGMLAEYFDVSYLWLLDDSQGEEELKKARQTNDVHEYAREVEESHSRKIRLSDDLIKSSRINDNGELVIDVELYNAYVAESEKLKDLIRAWDAADEAHRQLAMAALKAAESHPKVPGDE